MALDRKWQMRLMNSWLVRRIGWRGRKRLGRMFNRLNHRLYRMEFLVMSWFVGSHKVERRMRHRRPRKLM